MTREAETQSPDIVFFKCPPRLADGTPLKPCLALRYPTKAGYEWASLWRHASVPVLPPDGCIVLESYAREILDKARRLGLVVVEGVVEED